MSKKDSLEQLQADKKDDRRGKTELMIKTYWKRGDKSEETDTSSFNGQEKKQISAFIHHEEDARTIREAAALDACVHTHLGPVSSLNSPLSLHICD